MYRYHTERTKIIFVKLLLFRLVYCPIELKNSPGFLHIYANNRFQRWHLFWMCWTYATLYIVAASCILHGNKRKCNCWINIESAFYFILKRVLRFTVRLKKHVSHIGQNGLCKCSQFLIAPSRDQLYRCEPEFTLFTIGLALPWTSGRITNILTFLPGLWKPLGQMSAFPIELASLLCEAESCSIKPAKECVCVCVRVQKHTNRRFWKRNCVHWGIDDQTVKADILPVQWTTGW